MSKPWEFVTINPVGAYRSRKGLRNPKKAGTACGESCREPIRCFERLVTQRALANTDQVGRGLLDATRRLEHTTDRFSLDPFLILMKVGTRQTVPRW